MTYLAQLDPEMWDWVIGAVHPVRGGGSFVRALAEAALHADPENYAILRPVLLKMKEKYPEHEAVGRELQKTEEAGGG